MASVSPEFLISLTVCSWVAFTTFSPFICKNKKKNLYYLTPTIVKVLNNKFFLCKIILLEKWDSPYTCKDIVCFMGNNLFLQTWDILTFLLSKYRKQSHSAQTSCQFSATHRDIEPNSNNYFLCQYQNVTIQWKIAVFYIGKNHKSFNESTVLKACYKVYALGPNLYL